MFYFLIIVLLILYWVFQFISNQSQQKIAYILLGLSIILLALFSNIIGIILLSLLEIGVVIKIIKLKGY